MKFKRTLGTVLATTALATGGALATAGQASAYGNPPFGYGDAACSGNWRSWEMTNYNNDGTSNTEEVWADAYYQNGVQADMRYISSTGYSTRSEEYDFHLNTPTTWFGDSGWFVADNDGAFRGYYFQVGDVGPASVSLWDSSNNNWLDSPAVNTSC